MGDKEIQIEKKKISSKQSMNSINSNKSYDDDNKNIEEKKLSQIYHKNFNETLFDYKRYSLLNNNPRKRKSEFDYELKEIKKIKDMSMKKKKKGWIKKTFIDKEKNKNDDNINSNKLLIPNLNSKKNNNINLSNLNTINEEESNKKSSLKKEQILPQRKEEEKEEETDLSELNMFNKIFKRSQDDFGIDLMNYSNDIKNKKNFKDSKNNNNIISRYRDYLKNKNPNKEQIVNYNHNFVFENNNKNNYENDIKFLEDIQYKARSSNKNN